jgi:serine-type D-Ala-D-Ala endopeptidase (penicillin-binding protein 7)
MQTKSWGTSVGRVLGSLSGMLAAGLAAFVCCAFATPAVAAGATPSNVVAKAKAPSGSAVAQIKSRRKARVVAERPSLGQRQGLRGTDDPLELKSSAALVMDQETDEVLLSKNAEAVLPIASITKLMTSIVVLDAGQSMDETLKVSKVALDTPKNNRSRLKVGAELSRGELMHLALMSSENRAAYSVGANYPGGLSALVEAMNHKARELGMSDSHFVEPTGLSSDNRSSAHDLALLVKAAYQHSALREYSTAPDAAVSVGRRLVQFRNTNSLVRSPSWEIGLQKTGYISEAGRCLVMQAQLAGRKLIMVLLDSTGRYSRIGDAERIRRWLDSQPAAPNAAAPSTHAAAAPAAAVVEQRSAAMAEGDGDLGRSGSDAF